MVQRFWKHKQNSDVNLLKSPRSLQQNDQALFNDSIPDVEEVFDRYEEIQ